MNALSKTVLISLLLLGMVNTSCRLHHDELMLYKNGFIPKNGCVKLNGYYLVKTVDLGGKPAYQAQVYYADGSLYISGVYYDSLGFENQIKKYPKSFDSYWGFYECNEDTIVMEMLYLTPSAIERDEMKATVSEGEITLLDDSYINPMYFINSDLKPDSTQNWIKKHRKYRIDK